MATRLLVVDDDRDFLETLELELGSEGFTVNTYSTVEGALDALQATSFDVVVTDLAMTQTGGLAFCEHLSRKHPELPVVVLTGHEEATTAALRLGARRVFIKPFSAPELAQAIREVRGHSAD